MSITIPLTTLCIGANLIMRMPDVYVYEFKSSESLDHLNVGMNDDEMGRFISDFMFGKLDTIQIYVGEDSKTPLFKDDEVAVANRARFYLNILAGVGVVSLSITVAAVIMLKKNGFEYEIRKKTRQSIVIYVVFLAVYIIFFIVSMQLNMSLGDYLGFVSEEDDILQKIITISMQIKLACSIGAVSSVIFGLAVHGLMKLTAPKMIFSRTEQ